MSTINTNLNISKNTGVSSAGSGGSSNSSSSEDVTYKGFTSSSALAKVDEFKSEATTTGNEAKDKVKNYKAFVYQSAKSVGDSGRGVKTEAENVKNSTSGVDADLTTKTVTKNSYSQNKAKILQNNKDLEEKYNEANEKKLQEKVKAFEKEFQDNQRKIENLNSQIQTKEQKLNSIKAQYGSDESKYPQEYFALSQEVNTLKNGEGGLVQTQARNQVLSGGGQNGDGGLIGQAKNEITLFNQEKNAIQEENVSLNTSNQNLAEKFRSASNSLKNVNTNLQQSKTSLLTKEDSVNNEKDSVNQASEEQKSEGKTIENVGMVGEAGCGFVSSVLRAISSIMNTAKSSGGEESGNEEGAEVEIDTPDLDTSFAQENTVDKASSGEAVDSSGEEEEGEDDSNKIKLTGNDALSIAASVVDAVGGIFNDVGEYGKAMQEDGFNQSEAITELVNDIGDDVTNAATGIIDVVANRIASSDEKIDDDVDNDNSTPKDKKDSVKA